MKTIYLIEKRIWKAFDYELESTKMELEKRNIFISCDAKISYGVKIGNNAQIDNGAQIGYGAKIGDYARIGDYAQIDYAQIVYGVKV